MAEIKFTYKNCEESEFEQRDKDLAQVKKEMEEIKAKKV